MPRDKSFKIFCKGIFLLLMNLKFHPYVKLTGYRRDFNSLFLQIS